MDREEKQALMDGEEKQAPVDGEENPAGTHQIRRVSFALDAPTNYVYAEEYSSNKTSTLISDVPMDLSTEIPEFKDSRLFQPFKDSRMFQSIDDSALAAEIDNLFIVKEQQEYEIEEYVENPILTREYVKRRESIRRGSIRRESLRMSRQINDRGEACHGKNECKENNNGNAGKEGFITSCNNDDMSTGSYANSSYVVEELLNTADLRMMLPKEEKNQMNINEFLAANGIRFLDESMGDNGYRDTLSKSKNMVDPKLVNYYKNVVRERIDYLYNFAGFLSEKMKELQTVIQNTQRSIDVEGINTKLLKRKRNESRNKAKIDWYTLRRINEMEFVKKIQENQLGLLEEMMGKERDLKRYEEGIEEKKAKLKVLREKCARAQARLENSDKAEIQAADVIMRMIAERKTTLENVKNEYEHKRRRWEENQMDEAMADRRIQKLRNEIEHLKNNLVVKNVSEDDLNELKRKLRVLERINGIKIIKITGENMAVEFFNNEIHFRLNEKMEVENCVLNVERSVSFYEFVNLGLPSSRLADCLKTFSGRFALATILKNAIEQLRMLYKVEQHCVKGMLYLKVTSTEGKRHCEIKITKNFRILEDRRDADEVRAGENRSAEEMGGCGIDLVRNPGLLQQVVLEKMNTPCNGAREC